MRVLLEGGEHNTTGRLPRGRARWAAWAAAVLLVGCLAPLRPPASGPGAELVGADPGGLQRVYRMARANRGGETYSAWFGDSDGRVLYFGLSPFWELWHAGDGDARADLREPGDHLIGRFDMARRRFLAPLRVRGLETGARGSVWDVLAHSNGRIYYTTFYEGLGSVRADGSDPRIHAKGGGWNELYESADGTIFTTRYAFPAAGNGARVGALAALAPDGATRGELRFEADASGQSAPKSLAVDPATGEISLNTDRFTPAGVLHETIRVTPDLRVLSRASAPPELLFMRFDSRARGFFAYDDGGTLVLELREHGRQSARRVLGPRAPNDFVQDMSEGPAGEIVVTLWSGRVFLARAGDGNLDVRALDFEAPPECQPPHRNAVFYSAFLHADSVFVTLHCDARVLELPAALALPVP